MWDWRSATSSAGVSKCRAPKFFIINRNNFSGRRLYSLIGNDVRLLVTESCKELVKSAKEHGTPDPIWLASNLTLLHSGLFKPSVILLCGKVAQKTFKDSKFVTHACVIEIPHPAARVVWTKAYIEQIRQQIQGV